MSQLNENEINRRKFNTAGVSSVTINDKMYIFGDSSVWKLPVKNLSSNIAPLLVHQNTTSVIPMLKYSPGAAINSNSFIVFTTATNTTAENNSTHAIISTLSFNFNSSKSGAWSILNTASAPSARQEYSVSLTPDKERAYLFGGSDAFSANSTDSSAFWVYYTKSALWKKLMHSYISTRCGHTSSMLSDGRMVIIGGYDCSASSNQSILNLIPMNQIWVFDTSLSTWSNPQILGTTPSARVYHSAIVSNGKNDIFVCGGQNEIEAPFQVYMGQNLSDMTAILNTNSWEWRLPTVSYNQPYPQSHALITLVNDTKIAFGFGENYNTVYDHFRIFDTASETWESSAVIDIGQTNNAILSSPINKTIVGIVIGCIASVVLCSYIVAIWQFGFKTLHLKLTNTLMSIKRELWKPRVGEPGWAETSRLVLKLVFFFLFIYLISSLTNQVINSPIIDQQSYEITPEMTIDVPDVKFCFNYWVETNLPYIRCATDFGAQCSNFITQLPTAADNAELCFLFRSPSSFLLGQTSGRLQSNGSFLKFDYYSSQKVTTSDRILQVDVYNKHHNPNLDIYQLSNTSGDFEWNDGYEKETYFNKQSHQSLKNSYRLKFGYTSTINYELIKRVSLNPDVWNFVGIASSVKTQYEIDTTETPEFFSGIYDPASGAPQPLGSIHVVPTKCETKVLREQKAFAFINAMGIFGGLFGLLFSLQSCLFGYRPRSPWGYMHRWSFGQLKSSLIRGLQSNFFPNLPVQQKMEHQHALPVNHGTNTFSSINMHETASVVHPLAINTSSPVRNITSTSYLLPTSPTIRVQVGQDEKELRMALMEDRIHVLERLFQAYYIDDEIFRSLDHAIRNDSLSSSTVSINSSTTANSKSK